jgi:FixJ family two-component response regulator
MTIAPAVGMALKILVVDDDLATRNGLKELLQRAHYDVIAVGTFAEGRSALIESNPDLLIVDVRLGEFNGLQLAAIRPRAIPVIVLTGFPDSVLAIEARNLGAEYVLKPIPPAEFMTLVWRKLGSRQQFRATTARRWERKTVTRELGARINNRPARILDVSYGGLRLASDRAVDRSVPSSFTLEVPSSGLSVPIDVVWTTQAGETWVFGASVTSHEDATSQAWQGFVDAIP